MADGEATVVDDDTDDVRTRPRWRTPVSVALVVALLALAGGLIVRYRHDHRDEWVSAPHAWHHIEVSDDGRTLTFVAFPDMPCFEPDGVTIEPDPTAGGTVTATVRMKQHTMADGHLLFCPASLGLIPDPVVTFDHPIPAGTVFVDSTAPHLWNCDTPTRQVIGEPTTPADPYGCGP